MKMLNIIRTALGLVIIGSGAQGSTDYTLNDVSQSVRVTVTVNKKARLEVLKSPEEFVVIPEDLARGYADIPNAVRLKVWSNSLEGVVVRASLEDGLYNPYGIRRSQALLAFLAANKGSYISFDGEPSTIYESSTKETATLVAYDLRLYLPKGSPPGIYRFKLTFSATPK